MRRHPLRVERELRGWSQARVAEDVGTSTRSIVRWEQGEVLPQPYYRERLCALFGKNALELSLQPPLEESVLFEEPLPVQPRAFLSDTMVASSPSNEKTLLPEQAQALTASLEQDPLLSTKLLVPMLTHGLITRPRLTDLLMAGMKCALTLISAPAGSGKTTAIAEWLRTFSSPGFAAWVSLDEEDNDPQRFWLYVLIAIESSRPGLCLPLIHALRTQRISSWPAFLKHVLNAFLQSEQSLFLVLDDYHAVTNPVIHQAMTYLLEHLPRRVHLIVATRSDPPWPLSRLRLQGQIQEIHMDQLSGTSEEVATFFDQVMQIELAPAIIEEITRRTEGWMAGIQLLALSLRESIDVPGILELVQGNQRTIFDYLMEEVIICQSPQVQEFLLDTSILGSLNASACDAVRGKQGSQAILEFLDRANLFVVPLDKQRHWYRYHHLFAQALRSRLERMYDRDRMRALHQRASIWFAQFGSPHETIAHALCAQEWELAAKEIERIPFEQVWSSQHIQLQQWLESLPADLLRQYPCLCLRYAFLLLWHARLSECEYWLAETEKTLMAHTTEVDGLCIPAQGQQKLFGKYLSLRTLAAVMRGKGEKAVALGLQAEQYFEPPDCSLRAHTAFYLGQAHYLCDQPVQGVQVLQEAMQLADTAGNQALKNMILGHLMLQLSLLGQPREAWSLRACKSNIQELRLFASASCIYEAALLREWNELEAAASLAEQAVERGRASEKLILLPHWYAIYARCLFSKGDLIGMEQALQSGEQLNETLHNPRRLGFSITVERVRLWLARGDLEAAKRWLQRYHDQEEEPTAIARVSLDIASIRVLIADAQYTRALEKIEQALQQARAAQRKAHIIELLVLQALAYQAANQEQAGCTSLAEAVELAQAQGYKRVFVDEGQPLAGLLLKLKQRQPEHQTSIEALLETFSATRDCTNPSY
ncbi:helix-turn-helix domain-containing protein [Ktedonobacter sp. SOSP1-85]|uniref:helix-turn-helix domain-containing protein n=1 Tax=Ktedonobacter sp. SOSP1-85 TaxID=2778367 RepID=UPI00191699E3|nr:helix-turn-helix domain-containing protein [Ktedonobacter sp. SOSP1-85]